MGPGSLDPSPSGSPSTSSWAVTGGAVVPVATSLPIAACRHPRAGRCGRTRSHIFTRA